MLMYDGAAPAVGSVSDNVSAPSYVVRCALLG